jgi:hypothetical protein
MIVETPDHPGFPLPIHRGIRVGMVFHLRLARADFLFGMSSTTYSKEDTRRIISPVARAMLAKYGSLVSGGSGSVRLVRV